MFPIWYWPVIPSGSQSQKSIEVANLHQQANYWEFIGTDKFNNALVESPVALEVRWSDEDKEIQTPEGTTKLISASIVTNQEIKVRSIVQLYGASELYEVIKTSIIPDIKNRHIRRRSMLSRYREDLPDVGTGTGT